MNSKVLKSKYESLSDEELLQIINENAKEYTEEAQEIAKEEIEKRKLKCNLEDIRIDNEVNDDKEGYASKNTIASIVLTIGIIVIIVSIIWGIIYISMSLFIGFGILFSGVVLGFLICGFGEIINLLHQIYERQKIRE